MPVFYDARTHAVRAASYALQLDPSRPRADLFDPAGRSWSRLSLLASAHPLDSRDTARPSSGPRLVTATEDCVELVQELNSSIWSDATVRLRCHPDRLELTFAIRTDQARRLDRVTVLGGDGRLQTGAAGSFRSGIGFNEVFVPNPAEPVAPIRPAAVPGAISVIGDAEPGRLHGVFSPAPFAYAFGRDGDWLGWWLRAGVEDCTFTDLRYQPLDGGYWLEFDFQGGTEVAADWQITAVLRPTESEWTALSDYRDDLLAHDLAPRTSAAGQNPAWWTEPLFCGWGAQCAEATRPQHQGATAASLCCQDLYDRWLDRLGEHGIVPGTIVLDDRWQQVYGTAEPAPEQWPDLRSWIAARHADGQRVLLWWKAWDPEGLPAQECVTDADGIPVSVDPGNPRYRRRLASIVERLLGEDGLGADGFKIDFTQRAPGGADLRSDGPSGAAGLHELLSAIYRTAKRVRPDSLIITHTVNPLFADVSDMIRLNDITERNLAGERVPVTDQMIFRQRVSTTVLPNHPIDTDQWPMPDHEQWLAYCAIQPELGVPALYYVDMIDNSGELITDADLETVAKLWQIYREQVR
jgi:hypothetical protein